MTPDINIIKGIHPGIILKREIEKRLLIQGRFALSINEFPQTIGAIINGHRRMNPALSLKIEQAFGWEEGFLMVLQSYFDIKQEKLKQHEATPNLNKLRTALFWDIDINNIDWQKYKEAIIKRVFERGNEEEKEEITHFYSQAEIEKVLHKL